MTNATLTKLDILLERRLHYQKMRMIYGQEFNELLAQKYLSDTEEWIDRILEEITLPYLPGILKTGR
jgi:hypothetical protein